ncbi:hypothetical protein [Bacteroides sp. UBA939]|uniref:hypothetical protein n=1 Tax=Bacteroides sp. UBA939 TaxID=1946092 RepID=UPI0025B875A4|nr:hypothetical protein [Bacteroides sp. UBA939]
MKRIVLQIHKDEEKALSYIRGCSCKYRNCDDCYGVCRSSRVQTNNRHGRLEERKQAGKLSMVHAGQGTETLGAIFMLGIIHATKDTRIRNK